MKTRWLLTFGIAIFCMAASAQWTLPTADVPAFHTSPPAKSAVEPPILHGQQLTGPNFQLAWQVKAYKDAAKVSNVLYQLPCYCRCDRGLGHTSLRSCFEGLHGAECSTCSKEAIYAYRMTRKGWTPERIRAGIERGDWQSIDLNAIGKTPAHS